MLVLIWFWKWPYYGCGVKITPFFNPLCGKFLGLSWKSTHLYDVCIKSVGIWDDIINPYYGFFYFLITFQKAQDVN